MEYIYSIMGVCPQHDLLWDTLTGREHLLFYGRLKGLKGERAAGRGVGAYVNRYASLAYLLLAGEEGCAAMQAVGQFALVARPPEGLCFLRSLGDGTAKPGPDVVMAGTAESCVVGRQGAGKAITPAAC